MQWIDNLAVVVYTNETYFPILKLFIKYFRRYCPANPHIYVVANNTKNMKEQFDNVTFLDGNVEFHANGNHFSHTMKNVLPLIKEEYIFWFCDDYMMTSEVDMVQLNNLFRFVKEQNIDMFTFATTQRSVLLECKPYEVDYESYGLSGEAFVHIAMDYKHRFSVQPCIWKKSSLERVVNENDISLHGLDCSEVINPETYTIVGTPYIIYGDLCPTCPHKFAIQYIEIIRHGAFLLYWNGHYGYSLDWYFHKGLMDIIQENRLA